MAVLSDGNSLVAERIETVREPRPHRLRLISANPDYTAYNPPREDRVMSGRISVILSGTAAGMSRAVAPYSPKRTQAPSPGGWWPDIVTTRLGSYRAALKPRYPPQTPHLPE